jgi:hypothetical protein
MPLLHSSLGRIFFSKIMMYWYTPNISIFYQYATMMVLFQGISWMHILSHFIAWVGLLFLTLFMTIFWPELFQEPRCLLWFILINCGASQSTNVLMVFFCNGPFGWPITKNLWNPPSPSRNHIYLFHLQYFTQNKIDLHNFTLTFTRSVNKYYYEIYTYIECKS